jgi:SNF2 family DNA or RNA helicase
MLTPKDIFPYQEEAIDFLYERDESLALIPMGGGKTMIAATAASELLQEGIVSRWLILAPKRVCLLVWRQEFAKWSHLDEDRVAVAVGVGGARRDALESDKSFVVMNYDNLIWMIDTYGGVHNFDGIIFDEVSRMKNPQGKRHKKIKKYLTQFKVRMGLTGTPTSNGIKDLYGQVYCVDCGCRLGRSHGHFKRDYFQSTGPMVWQIEPQPDALDRATEAIADISFQISNSVYADQLPSLHRNTIEVEMSPEMRDIYKEMEEEFLIELKDDNVMAANAGVMLNKLQQIVDGFIYTDTGAQWFHDAKINALEEIIESQQGAPLLVVYKYRRELEALRGRWDAPYLGAGVTDVQAEKAVDDWNAGKLPILYVHPASAGHGLNLQDGGDTLVWFGQTWSLEEHDQMIARLRRQGQKAGVIHCHYIVMRDSIDGTVLDALASKKVVDNAVIAGIKERNKK